MEALETCIKVLLKISEKEQYLDGKKNMMWRIGCEMVTAFNWLRLWHSAGFCVQSVAHSGFIKAGNVLVSIVC
jgi:hypothetical protein